MPHNLSGCTEKYNRVDAVRELLIEAGVPDYKIRMGAFGDAGLTQGKRVEMLIRNAYFVAI